MASLQEAAILSTCNRVEVYARGEGQPPDPREIAEALAVERGAQPDDFAPYLYAHCGEDAVRHLCLVACGVDSMVVGETDILGQVREAFLAAAGAGATGKFFTNLFQTVFATAKTVHTQTAIGRNKVSVGSVAVDMAQRLFGDLSAKTVLVIGAGDMGKATLAHLAQRGGGDDTAGQPHLRERGGTGREIRRHSRAHRRGARPPGAGRHRRGRVRRAAPHHPPGARARGHAPPPPNGRCSSSTSPCRATSTRR